MSYRTIEVLWRLHTTNAWASYTASRHEAARLDIAVEGARAALGGGACSGSVGSTGAAGARRGLRGGGLVSPAAPRWPCRGALSVAAAPSRRDRGQAGRAFS